MDRPPFGPLIGCADLAGRLRNPDLRIIDFRWYYDHDTGRSVSGRAAYEAGHIAGAAFVDLEADVTGERPDQGRHPLPDRDQFEHAMRVAGVGRYSEVVVYDDHGGFSAARLWWLLRYFGHESVAVLDGGLQAWRGPWSVGRDEIAEGDFLAVPNPDMQVDYHQVRGLPAGALLLDARRWERYVGEIEPVDPRAGHIAGARSVHWRGNLQPDNRFKSRDDLRRRFAEVGVRDGATVVAYCGSGVSACHNLLALELAGLGRGRLYPGSWSDWSTREDAPIAAVEEPPR